MISKVKRLVFDLIIIIIAGLTGIVLTKFVIFRATISGSSMEPTYYNGDICFALVHDNIERGDIVIVNPDDTGEHYIIKRVIGLPGDEVQVTSGYVYINGELYNEDYVNFHLYSGGLAEEPMHLGINEYFVMGDNRAVSKDSRMIGAVDREDIKGVVIRR